jgi:uncharacterized protein
VKGKKLFQKRPLSSLLIKPAGPDCSLACGYCFYSPRTALFPETRAHRMNPEILEETIRQALDGAGEVINIGWQGGEPTLAGLDFFRKAVNLEAVYGKGKTVLNGLQTNGLILDREWARFLKESGFLVGLSLDGPEHVHDRYRKDAAGRGTWAEVACKVRLLLDEGVAVNALTVVNEYSVRFADDIYEFHRSLGLRHMQFIPCVETDPTDHGRAAPYSAPAEEFGAFLMTVFDRWFAALGTQDQTYVRFFDSLFFSYVDAEPPECSLLPTCGNDLVVEHNGDVFPCDFFVEEEWKLGNVRTGRLVHMQSSARQRAFGARKAALPTECRACRWLRLCRGGCPKDRIRDPRDGGQDHFCRSYRMLFEYADERLKKLAGDWKQGAIR